ncbi:hypothetical protein FS837_006084 [Tulasnella sp. UAMH 9824]|nr:hypothetical protein FS837_006084 [Tulasnella sp. UAMH 9824]
MAESAHVVASPSKRKQHVVREEERFSRIYDALPSHLRQAEVPEPLKNLSTPENDRLDQYHKAAEQGKPPSETLANMYFIDEMKKAFNNESSEFPSYQLARLSKDRRYGYLVDAPAFTEEPPASPSTFLFFTLSSTADGRVFHGRYTWIDVPLVPLTNDDHQFRSMPIAIRERYPNGEIPCAAIAFHSFDEHLRLAIQDATSSPEQPVASNPTPPLSSSSRNRPLYQEYSEGVSTRPIQDEDAKDVRAEIRSETNIPRDRAEGSHQHQVNLNPDHSTALGDDSEHHFGPSQDENDHISKRADALQHGQILPPEGPPLRDIEGPVVGDEVNRRTTAQTLTGQAEDDSDRHVSFHPDSFVAVRQDPEDYHSSRQEHTKGIAEHAEALRHGQVVPDPDHYADGDISQMNSSVPASSSSSTTAKAFCSAPGPSEEPWPSEEPSKAVAAASRSRKGKERAHEPEGAADGLANVATDLIEAKLRVEENSSYAARIAMNEVRQTGVSQEQLESMVKFDEPSNAVEKIGGEEGAVENTGSYEGDQANSDIPSASRGEVRVPTLLPYVANPEQVSGPESQLPTGDGRRRIEDAQSSPPSRETSPARTETRSDITYDDGVPDDGQDLGGTSASQDPEQSGPTTPGPASGEKRKRTTTPSTGSEERPVTKQRRPGFEAEDEPSPLPQNRFRNSRCDLPSTPRHPVRRWNTDPSIRSGPDLEARSMIGGMPLRGLRTSGPIPEEGTEVAGSNSLSMATLSSTARPIAPDRAGDTEDDGRENEFVQRPIRVVLEPPRLLVERAASTQGPTQSPPTLGPAAKTMSTNDIQPSPSAEDPLRQASTSLLSDGTCVIKASYHVRITDRSATEESQPTSSSAPPASSPVEPSTSPTKTPNQNLRKQRQIDTASQTDWAATTDRQGSSRPVIANGHAPEFQGLLRAWRAALINLDDDLLAEAGLRVTRGGISTQETRVEQTTEEAPDSQNHGEGHYLNLLLSLLQNFRGALSTLSPEILSAIGVEIICYRSRSRTLPNAPPLRDGSYSGPQESGARRPLGASDSDTTNLGQVLALLRDSLDRLSSAATTSTRPIEQRSDDFASSLGTSSAPHDRDGGIVAPISLALKRKNLQRISQTRGLRHDQPAATDARRNPPSKGSDTVEANTKRKDPKNKSKKGRNKENSDPSGPSKIATSDSFEDAEMTVLDVQPPLHTSDTPANDLPMPQTAVPSGSLQARPPSPMDTEWDDNKSEAEPSGCNKGEKQDSASPNSRDNETPSSPSTREQELPKESSSAQTTTASSSSKEKKLKKKKDSRKPGTTESSAAPAFRPGETSPTVVAPPEPSLSAPTVSEPPADSLLRRVGTPIAQTSTTPPAASPPSSRDEVMLDVESPQRLPERDMNHRAQIPSEGTFGEGPIVPDDEGPPPSSSGLETTTTGYNGDIPDSNITSQSPQNSTSGIGPAESAVENATANIPGDSWSESDLTEEYEESRANPFRLRDALHAAAAQDIMDELLPRSSRPSPKPSRDATPSIEANAGPAPTEDVDPLQRTPVQSRTSTPTNPPTGSAVVHQVIPGTSVPPEQPILPGSSSLNETSPHGNEEHHGEGSSLPDADAQIQDLVAAFGVWSLFYESATSTS